MRHHQARPSAFAGMALLRLPALRRWTRSRAVTGVAGTRLRRRSSRTGGPSRPPSCLCETASPCCAWPRRATHRPTPQGKPCQLLLPRRPREGLIRAQALIEGDGPACTAGKAARLGPPAVFAPTLPGSWDPTLPRPLRRRRCRCRASAGRRAPAGGPNEILVRAHNDVSPPRRRGGRPSRLACFRGPTRRSAVPSRRPRNIGVREVAPSRVPAA